MYCSLITFLCVVGGVQIGPEVYKIDVYNQMDKAFYEVYVPIQHKDQVVNLIKFWHNFLKGYSVGGRPQNTPYTPFLTRTRLIVVCKTLLYDT